VQLSEFASFLHDNCLFHLWVGCKHLPSFHFVGEFSIEKQLLIDLRLESLASEHRKGKHSYAILMNTDKAIDDDTNAKWVRSVERMYW
jgi:hypothetical protein